MHTGFSCDSIKLVKIQSREPSKIVFTTFVARSPSSRLNREENLKLREVVYGSPSRVLASLDLVKRIGTYVCIFFFWDCIGYDYDRV